MSQISETRKCFDCHEHKELDNFYFLKSRGRYDYRCKRCASLRQKIKYNPERRHLIFIQNKKLCSLCKVKMISSHASLCFRCASNAKIGKKNWWGYRISAKLKGKPKSPEHAKKVGDRHRGVPKYNLRGEKNPRWNGLTPLKEQIRKSLLYDIWKISCFKRDDRKCIKCGEKNGRKLQVHHIIPFSYIIKKLNIRTIEDSEQCVLLWDINNGMTLCHKCHTFTDSYGERAKRYEEKPLTLF